uniref:cGMP-dependent protein kinase interacting domain-containing protein n=1 Tax=Angiostrongylus cantonensis TaxID=6313 RepID=A0A0K0D7I0_ANGCA
MYVPFESTNAMLDILNQAALRKSASPFLAGTAGSCSNNRNSYKASRSSSRNVPRSLSFHGGSLSLASPRGDELSRLLRTFEAEKARDLEAAEGNVALLKARIHDLERVNDQYQQNELELRDCIQQLQQRNESLVSYPSLYIYSFH